MLLLLPYKTVTRKGRKVTGESRCDGFPWKPLLVGDHQFLKAPRQECTKVQNDGVTIFCLMRSISFLPDENKYKMSKHLLQANMINLSGNTQTANRTLFPYFPKHFSIDIDAQIHLYFFYH